MIRIMNVVALVAAVLFSFGLYNIKYDTRVAEREVLLLRQEIELEKETLKVLRAEWSHLNQPDRIQKLAEKYLDLAPVGLGQIVSIRDVPSRPFLAEETRPDQPAAPGEPVSGELSPLEELVPPRSALAPRPKPLDLTRGGDAHG